MKKQLVSNESLRYSFLQSPFSGGQAESPPPAYSPRDDQGQQQAGMTTSQMDTGGNQVMDTSNPIMHSEPVPYEVRINYILYLLN